MNDRRIGGDDRRAASAAEAPPARDEQAYRAAVRSLNEQAERLGLLDALEAEPALIYTVTEGER